MSLPIICTLTLGELAARRAGLLPGLLAQARATESIPGGLRWRFDAEAGLIPRVAAVIDAERQCCRFLRFALMVDPDGGSVVLEVTGPPGTEDFLSTLLNPPPETS